MKNTYINKITPSKEDYLKVMLEFAADQGIRSSDIANALGISRASVSRMMGILKDEGYIIKEKYGTIILTESGRNTAVNIKKRYTLLKKFLNNVVGIEDAIASEDACRMEHLISPKTMDRIAQKLENMSK